MYLNHWVLITPGLTATASPTVANIHKKMFGSGNKTLINSDEEINSNNNYLFIHLFIYLFIYFSYINLQ